VNSNVAETAQARPLQKEKPLTDNAKIAAMGWEWVIWVLIAVMLGLYIWSHLTAGHRIGKKLQPFVDDLFGVTPSERESKVKPPANHKTN
jgi:hypothetical protein